MAERESVHPKGHLCLQGHGLLAGKGRVNRLFQRRKRAQPHLLIQVMPLDSCNILLAYTRNNPTAGVLNHLPAALVTAACSEPPSMSPAQDCERELSLLSRV